MHAYIIVYHLPIDLLELSMHALLVPLANPSARLDEKGSKLVGSCEGGRYPTVLPRKLRILLRWKLIQTLQAFWFDHI